SICFSLDQYASGGRFRTSDGDPTIDPVRNYTTEDGETVRLTGARDLAQFAAGSEQAQNAFIEQLFNQIVKQPMLAYGSDVLNHLRQSFVESSFNVRKLLLDIATLSALHGMEKTGRAS